MRRLLFLLLGAFLATVACQNKAEQKSALFEPISPAHSGIDFANTITENDSFNVLEYEYIYNGGGVGVGDFNLDGLPDLFFAGNMVSSRLYLNRGDFRFEDVTTSAGVTTDAWCTGVAICDINQDGWPDIHVATAHDIHLNWSANYFFINKSQKGGAVVFENLAEDMGLAASSYTMQAAFFDFDKDEDLDVFLINNSMEIYPRNRPYGQKKDGSGKSTDRLYENKGLNAAGIPIFEDVSRRAGIAIEGWSLGVKVMDFNADAYPDIYIANDFLSNDLLYINNQDGTFSNQITTYLKHQSHNSMGMDAADLNNDGANDLVILDMLPEDNLRKKTMFDRIKFDLFDEALRSGYQPQYIRNVLQANTQDQHFTDVGYYAGIAATDWSWSPLLADFDNDGLRDIYISNGYKKDVTDLDFVNYNTENRFSTKEERLQHLIQQLNEMEGVKKSNRIFINQGQFRFKDKTATSGIDLPSYSNGAVYADLDLDGDLDIVCNNLNDPAFVFENRNQDQQHYFRLKLTPDALAYGAKVWVYAGATLQYAEYYPQCGYLSNMEPVLHFGMDTLSTIDSLKILWPNQKVYRTTRIATNQVLELDAHDASNVAVSGFQPAEKSNTFFSTQNLLDFQPVESSFNDFKNWPLRFRAHSKPGPVLASGDVNGDGLDDVFVGGPAQQNGRFFLQTAGGQFLGKALSDSLGRLSEDAAALLFDADQDGDLDLYCVSGSSEFYAQPQLYQDRYYENDGLGNFSLQIQVLPKKQTAGACVTALDYDRDGDQDVFVGGRLIADQYPASPRSYLLQNNDGVFRDVTQELAPDLLYPGMVTAALASDLNQDGFSDLLLAGEWMPLQVYYNQKGRFQLDKSANGFAQTEGWWNCLASADFDQDGDTDFVAGNWGLNNPFEASPDTPISLYAKDYDHNGAIDALMTYYNQGEAYLFPARNTLAEQLPGIKSLFPDFRSYGLTPFKRIFPNIEFAEKDVFHAYQLASVYVENRGNGQFKLHALPVPVQWTPIFALLPADLNGDGLPDLLAVGNTNETEVLSGWYDAGDGYCLINEGAGRFSVMENRESGFKVSDFASALIQLPYAKGGHLYLVGIKEKGLKAFVKQ